MKLRRPFSLVFAPLAFLPLACGDASPPATSSGDPVLDNAGPHESVVARHDDDFSAIGMKITRAKILDAATGEVRDVAVDARTGAAVDFSALRAKEIAARRAKNGAFEETFASAVAGAPNGEAIRADVLAIAHGPRDADFESLLTQAGATVDHIAGDLATIDATPAVLTKLARDARIDGIAQHVASKTTALQAAKDLVEDSLWWPHMWGFGSDLEIALVEPNACIRRTHQDFQFVHWDPRAGSASCAVDQGWHSTAVAGTLAAMRMINGAWQAAGLFEGHLFEGDTTDGVVARNPHFINMSATHSPIEVRGMDASVYDKRITFLAGSGNTDDNLTYASCDAYNILCVGGYLHNNTVGPANFGDDVQASGAMWQNPASGREEPDLVGQFGVTAPWWDGDTHYSPFGGTSFSTPAVTGLAALLVANNRAILDRQPTLMRALLVASAISHTVNDGDATRLPIMNDSWDDRAGAGAPRGDVAATILSSAQYHAKHVVKGTDFDSTGKYAQTFSVTAAAGQRVRMSLAWDNCPRNPLGYPNGDALAVDLDLTVSGPNVPLNINPGPIRAAVVVRPIAGFSTPFVATNLSHVDNYETVEFVAPVAGSYVMHVSAPRWDKCEYDNGYATNIALAWSKQ